MQTGERRVYSEFVQWLLHLSEELPSLGHFITNGKCSIKNGGLGVFEASWRMKFSHSCKSLEGILRVSRCYNAATYTDHRLTVFQTCGFLEKNMRPVPEQVRSLNISIGNQSMVILRSSTKERM